MQNNNNLLSERFPPIPTIAFYCLCLAWLLPGLIGHEPWKPDEAYTFGLVRHIAATGDWIVPTLAGEPFLEKPPLFFISASILMQWCEHWLNPADAARLAAGCWMAIAFAGLATAARTLFGNAGGRWAVVLMLGCIGLPVRAHQMIADTALLAGFCWGIAGLCLAKCRPIVGGVLLGAGGAVAFLSKGLLGPGCLGISALALLLHPDYRQRTYLQALFVALIIGLPLPALWSLNLYLRDPVLFWTWLDTNNFGRFSGKSHLGPSAPRYFYTRTLYWYAFPAMPLMLWAGWLALRRKLPFSLRQLGVPVVTLLVTLGVLSTAADARELYAKSLLPSIVLLALSTLPIDAVRGGRWAARFVLAFCLLMLSLLVLVGIALSSGWPSVLMNKLSQRFVVGWTPSWHPATWFAFTLIALLILFLWRLIPANGVKGFIWRWSLCYSLLWGTLSTLWLPALDYSKRYREIFTQLAPRLHAIQDAGGCVASYHFGEPQRALLEYYARFRTLRLETKPEAKQCRWLLVQTLHDQLPALLHVKEVLRLQRPGDEEERFYLFHILSTEPISFLAR